MRKTLMCKLFDCKPTIVKIGKTFREIQCRYCRWIFKGNKEKRSVTQVQYEKNNRL